ncbi:MAG: VWA domain-containing protein, partial [Methanosarcinaceae archaeon]|nr:VWA domain-containing protein [Methanosarcinaceae archaeon]
MTNMTNVTTMKIPPDVLEFAKYVQQQAAIPYLNYVTEKTNVLAYQMNTNIVLSHTLLTHSNDAIKTVVAHEIAHRSVMPATRLEQNTHSAIAKLEGIPQNKAHVFLNIVYDLIIDRHNLWQEWSDTYIAGLKEARAYSYISTHIDESTVFNNICLSIQNEYDMVQFTLNNVEQNIFDLLYTDTRPFTKRLQELARIFKNIFSNSSSTECSGGQPQLSCGNGNGNGKGNGSDNDNRNTGDLPFDDKISASDAEKIAAKLSQIFDDVHPGRLNKLDLKIQSEFRRRRALKIALPLLHSTNVSKDSRQHA